MSVGYCYKILKPLIIVKLNFKNNFLGKEIKLEKMIFFV